MENIKNLKKEELVVIFNDQIKTFIKQIIKITETANDKNLDLSKIKYYKNSLKAGLVINKYTAIDMFSGYILSEENKDFTKKIGERDYNYFYNIKYEKDVENSLADMIQITRNIMNNLNDENKENIFGHLENLCLLTNLYTIKKIEG
jgi:hypothetical protein